MTYWALVTRSLRFYWRTHLGVLLGAAVGTAILVGSLIVGDSVRHTLRDIALLRLGNTYLAMSTQDRFFRSSRAQEISTHLSQPTAAALQMQGAAILPDTAARANQVQVVGVDETFWKFAPDGRGVAARDLSGDSAMINQRLADQLAAMVGSTILLRLEMPSVLPRDAPLSTDQDLPVAMRLRVTAILSDREFGRFSLLANQVAPLTVFVPLSQLQKRLEKPGRANLMLMGAADSSVPPTVERGNTAMASVWDLADAELELHALPDRGVAELRTDRVFLESAVVMSARQVPGAKGILTYFVNRIAHGQQATPYSMVAALESSELLPSDMTDDQIVLNDWVAQDLEVTTGDVVDLSYYVMGPMRSIEERTSQFVVRAIVPIEGEAADPTLMPAFPGLTEREHCRDWEPGFPIALDAIRERDETYWTRYRGTPKAFITLSAGQRMWRNRFGDLTAVRFPIADTSITSIQSSLRDAVKPAQVGLFFLPVREQALAASGQGHDFGMLFIGFSFFLIIAALLLMGMLFTFGVEQRAAEVGTLLALGYRVSRVRLLLLIEGVVIAIAGGIGGVLIGLLYTRLVITGLSTVWLKAAGSTSLQMSVAPVTLLGGGMAGAMVALLTIGLSIRHQASRSARELLVSDGTGGAAPRDARLKIPRWGTWLAVLAGLASLVLTVLGLNGEVPSSGLFFGAGSLLLATCLGLSQTLLLRLDRTKEPIQTLVALGVRGVARRRGRSLATVCLLACGCFMIIAVDAFRHHPMDDQQPRTSGTGGFSLLAESTLPIYHDLGDPKGREVLGLEAPLLDGLKVMSFRVRQGDDASCLNLNKAQQPRLLGVDAQRLEARGAFTFIKTADGSTGPAAWGLLTRTVGEDIVPAIGDQATVYWALGRNVGDTLDYVDGYGRGFKLKIVGMTANTVLQGSLLIDERAFTQHFPSASGYQMFLIDSTEDASASQISQMLSQGLRDWGLEVTSASRRLASYNEVENTYLSIFQALGGLGLILGSVGLGIVVLRNVLDRRSELAVLRAVGFRRSAVQKLVLTEHWLLLGLGVACGVVSAAVAVLPALQTPGRTVPYGQILLTLAAVIASGALWTYLAAKAALHGNILRVLRKE